MAAALGPGQAQATQTDGQQLAALQEQLGRIEARLQQLSAENRNLRDEQARTAQEMAALTASRGSAAAPDPAGSASPAASSALPEIPAPAPTVAGVGGEGLRLWGYGEVYYSAPTGEGSKTQADLARAVFGIGYAFDERTEFNSEYEVEHAVTSASDVGEFEVEQFYVDRRLGEAANVRGGLMLMPFGFLNEHHEPTQFYGVQRNFVETLIIPSTWREGGVGFNGATHSGFGWNAGLTTGFDLSKWDFAPQYPPYATALALENSGIAPLQATHQELALANAHHLSQYVAVSYFGAPGLLLGAAASTGQAVAPPLPPGTGTAGDPRVTLWEAHARWRPAKWDWSALYARGSISELAAVNAAHPGAVNPLPSSFHGYFLEGAYQLWQQGDYRLAPFLRYEVYDLGASYAGTAGPVIPTGLVPLSPAPGDLGYWPQNHDRVWTAGANFYVGPHVVVKGDYQWFEVNSGFRRFDLGLGVNF